MPTENECKFILNINTKEKFYKELAKEKAIMHQGYLISGKGIVLRCRKTTSYKGEKPEYFMTFKLTANSGRVVEIEKKIDDRDFNDMWEACLNKLEKIRYYIKDSQDQLWEVDFFKDQNGENYFCMAELEMPEGQAKPKLIPHFIKDNLLYEVDLKDNRFSSKMIADIKYATEIYNTLLKENKK